MRGAADLFIHEVANHHARELSGRLGSRDDWPEEWNRSSDISDWTLRLTPELALKLVGEMHDLVEGYRALADGEGIADTEQVRVHSHVIPVRTG